MKDFLDSLIIWELIFLGFMALTYADRVINFSSQPMPKIEQLLPAKQ